MKFLMLVCVEEDSFENDEAARRPGRPVRTADTGGQRELSLAR